MEVVFRLDDLTTVNRMNFLSGFDGQYVSRTIRGEDGLSAHALLPSLREKSFVL